MILQVSWDEARRLIEKCQSDQRREVIEITIDFLEVAMGWNMPFCDAHRVTMTDMEGQAFLEWLLEEQREGPTYKRKGFWSLNNVPDLTYEIF